MKLLCFSKYIFLLFFMPISLFASLHDKSAMIYYGKEISYPMVGIHDYIIVKPENTNVYSHGFSVYKNKIYARILLDSNTKIFNKKIKTIIQNGFSNVYFDVNENNSKNIQKNITNFLQKFSELPLIVNSKIKSKSKNIPSQFIKAIVEEPNFELTMNEIKKFKKQSIDIIKLQYRKIEELEKSKKLLKAIEVKGLIPYITNRSLDLYGKSSKNAIKREVFTLIDESKDDRTLLSAHQYGAVPLEYLGYIQKLHNINKGLPNMKIMRHYAGVVIWLGENYKDPIKLIRWVKELEKIGIKIAFANSFGFSVDARILKPLGIDIYEGSRDKKILYQDEMMAYDIAPPVSISDLYMYPESSKNLLTYEDAENFKSVLAAITPWGGYAVSEAFMIELENENVWVIDPFKFFAEALRLKKLLVPDTTTENGKRLLFSHVDGDGMVSRVEFNPELFSGDIILEKILKVYKIPHSVSLIGAEVFTNGLYPEFSQTVLEIARKMYALKNVEPATHTFTHPFFWGKIKDDTLDEQYRLKPKDYIFSLDNELRGSLQSINSLLKKNNPKKAQTVFWSGDCSPRLNALEYIYKHKLLNINGGYTIINNINPWLTLVAPIGLERGAYYQIYTGAQNENVFTNNWLGPFWGFKRVVQTFKLTNSPKRLKPIDIYYHLYSGSKTASLNALKYIFDWAIKQDTMPIYTSEYIVKAMDYFTVSMANNEDTWLIDGMKNLRTLRLENENAHINMKNSISALGVKHIEKHTYISLDASNKHIIEIGTGDIKRSYLISANAKVIAFKTNNKSQSYSFDAHVDLKLNFYLPEECTLKSIPKAASIIYKNKESSLLYHKVHKADINVLCR